MFLVFLGIHLPQVHVHKLILITCSMPGKISCWLIKHGEASTLPCYSFIACFY